MTYICSYTPLLQKHERNKSLSHTNVAVRVWIADWSLFRSHVFIRLEERCCLGNAEELWTKGEGLFRCSQVRGGIKQGLPSATDEPRHLYPQKFGDAPPAGHMHALSLNRRNQKPGFKSLQLVCEAPVADTSGPVPPSGVHGRKSPPSPAETASIHTLLVAVKLLRSQ